MQDESEEGVSLSCHSENSNLSCNLSSNLPSMPQYFTPSNPIKHAPDLSKLQYPNIMHTINKYGKYPDTHRILIWRYLLSLPMNVLAYENLMRLGVHPAYKNLRKCYPIKSQRLFGRTQRLLSALAHWCPILAEVDYLPALVYPFAKVIEHNDLILFETVMSVLVHWHNGVLSTFPQPPVQLLQTVEECVMREDAELGMHMRSTGFHPVQYVWPLLQSMFSEVMPKSQWVIVMDHVFTLSEKPQLVLAVAAAYFLQLRDTYMLVKDSAQLAACVRTMTPVDLSKLLKTAAALLPLVDCSKCPPPHDLPISKPNQASYPILEGYPKYVIELGSQIKQQILNDEKAILRQKQLVYDLQKKSKDLLKQEARLKKQQEEALILEKERIYQKTAEAEVEVIRRKSMASKDKARRVAHIKELEERMGRALQADDQLRKLQHENLIASYKQRDVVRRQELAEQQELEELKGLELRTIENVSNLAKMRIREDSNVLGSIKEEQEENKVDIANLQARERWRAEEQIELMKRQEALKLKEIEFEKKRLKQMQAIQEKQEELFRKQRELELIKAEHERKMRRLAEEEVFRRPDIEEGDVRSSPVGFKSTHYERMPSQESQAIHELLPEEKKHSDNEAQSSGTEKAMMSSEGFDTAVEERHAKKHRDFRSANGSSDFNKNTGAGLTGIPQGTFNPRAQNCVHSTEVRQVRYEVPQASVGVLSRDEDELVYRHNCVKQQLEGFQRRMLDNEAVQSDASDSSNVYSSLNNSASAPQSPEHHDAVSGTSVSGEAEEVSSPEADA